jgi:hypothetical protein
MRSAGRPCPLSRHADMDDVNVGVSDMDDANVAGTLIAQYAAALPAWGCQPRITP